MGSTDTTNEQSAYSPNFDVFLYFIDLSVHKDT